MSDEQNDVRIPVSEAAGEDSAAQGDLRERVRRIVVDALLKRQADPAALREVMHATLDGIGDGLRPQAATAGESLRAAMHGMDEAFSKTLLAMKMAMDESWQSGRRFADEDLRAAYEAVRGFDDDLVATLKQTAERSQGTLRDEFTRWQEHMSRAGMASLTQSRDVLTALSRQMTEVGSESGREAVRSAQLASERLGAVTSGILRGLADSLDQRAD